MDPRDAAAMDAPTVMGRAPPPPVPNDNYFLPLADADDNAHGDEAAEEEARDMVAPADEDDDAGNGLPARLGAGDGGDDEAVIDLAEGASCTGVELQPGLPQPPPIALPQY